MPPEVEKMMTQWASEGKTVLSVVAERILLGAFAAEDEIRPDSKEAVAELHRLGIRVAMISGDSKTVADSVAKRIGIDDVAAGVLPADKASAVKRFQAGDKRVGMVGDGVTTHQRWRPRMSESRLVQERMWPLSQQESCWCAAIHETLWERSNCPVLPTGR